MRVPTELSPPPYGSTPAGAAAVPNGAGSDAKAERKPPTAPPSESAAETVPKTGSGACDSIPASRAESAYGVCVVEVVGRRPPV